MRVEYFRGQVSELGEIYLESTITADENRLSLYIFKAGKLILEITKFSHIENTKVSKSTGKAIVISFFDYHII